MNILFINQLRIVITLIAIDHTDIFELYVMVDLQILIIELALFSSKLKMTDFFIVISLFLFRLTAKNMLEL